MPDQRSRTGRSLEAKVAILREFMAADDTVTLRGFVDGRDFSAPSLSRWADDENGARGELEPWEQSELDRRRSNKSRGKKSVGVDLPRRPHLGDAQKIKIIREFLNTKLPMSFRDFVKEFERKEGESVSHVSLSRWVKEACQGNLQGLTERERTQLEQRTSINRKGAESAPGQAKHRAPRMGREKETEFLRGFLSQPRGARLVEYLRNGSHGINERSAYELARSAKTPGGRSALTDDERKELAERLEENLRSRDFMRRPVTMTDAPHVPSGGLGSSAMASAAAAQPTPTPLSSSDSYGATPLPLEAAPTPLPGIESFDRIAGLYGTALPPIASFDQAPYSGPYGTGRAPSPTPYTAPGHPGYGGGQGPARGGR